MIYILGLGPSENNNIKEELKNFLLNNKDKQIVVRTKEHPAVAFLDDNEIDYVTCDKFYEESADFLTTYTNITNYILESNKVGDVIYLVPGHPMVAELTTKLILENTTDVKIIGGESFLDSCFNSAQFDPVEGFTLLDATNVDSFQNIDATKHILITQCYDDLTAANISVELDGYYPYDHKLLVMEQVGCADEKIYSSELAELSAVVGEEINNLRTIYVPPYKDALSYNLKNYVPTPEFTDEKDSLYLINNVEKSVSNIKKLIGENADKELVECELAKIIFNILDFETANDEFYELDNIIAELKVLKGKQNG